MPISWLTIDDTAKVLGVSSKTIRRMIHRGELRAYRFGRAIRISSDDLEAAGQPVTPSTVQGVR